MGTIREFYEHMIRRGLAAGDTVIGCSDAEVERVAAAHEIAHLPEAYAEFLGLGGRRFGALWIGSTAFYPDVLTVRDDYIVELANELEVVLPAHQRLPFYTHQSYEYMWLDISEGRADPPVWQIHESHRPPGPRLLSSSFTELLILEARSLVSNPNEDGRQD